VTAEGPRLEVEAKAAAKDLKAVEAKLGRLGAVLEANKVERDEYWAHPARNFGETDEALRLRITTADDGGGWSGADLTYKGPKLDAVTKSRREEKVDLGVDAVPALRRVLEGLGFRPFATVTKERREFEAAGLTVCLDRVEEVGDYVEVELVTDNLEAGRVRVLDFFKELGLNPSERRSYLELKLTKR
jgi:adenylate cyclase, class 2